MRMSILLGTLSKVFNLSNFNYNKEILHPKSLNAFTISTRDMNDANNKTRENIIGAIINKKVPEDYYILRKWLHMKQNIFHYVNKLTDNTQPYISIKCTHKAGRKNNYDFLIVLDYQDGKQETFMIELKFNASTIEDTPQFVSPMKPSQYMSNSYETYFYQNYLPKLSNISGIPMPTEEDYLQQIHSNAPKCMIPYQNLYYRGCRGSSKFSQKEEDIRFYELAKQLSNDSISTFIDKTDLNTELLSSYLQKSQENKIYMLYSNKSFVLQKSNMDDYVIEHVEKNANKFRYECTSKNGKKMNVLLRWKNGNGVAFPAFQIS